MRVGVPLGRRTAPGSRLLKTLAATWQERRVWGALRADRRARKARGANPAGRQGLLRTRIQRFSEIESAFALRTRLLSYDFFARAYSSATAAAPAGPPTASSAIPTP